MGLLLRVKRETPTTTIMSLWVSWNSNCERDTSQFSWNCGRHENIHIKQKQVAICCRHKRY